MKTARFDIRNFLMAPQKMMTVKRIRNAEDHKRNILMGILGIAVCLGIVFGSEYLIQMCEQAGYMEGYSSDLFEALPCAIEALLDSKLCSLAFGSFSAIPCRVSYGNLDAFSVSGYASYMGTVLKVGWGVILAFFAATIIYNIAGYALERNTKWKKGAEASERIYSVVFYGLLAMVYVMVFSFYPILLCCGVGSVICLISFVADTTISLESVIACDTQAAWAIYIVMLIMILLFCAMEIGNLVRMMQERSEYGNEHCFRNNLSTMSPMLRRLLKPLGWQALILLIINAVILAIVVAIVVAIVILCGLMALVAGIVTLCLGGSEKKTEYHYYYQDDYYDDYWY